jgi:hypothetical protein
VAACRQAAEKEGASATTLYRAACLCARASGQAARDEKLLADERAKNAQEYADRAMDLLRRAVAAGFRDIREIRGNPNLAPLRDRRDFQELLRAEEGKAKKH